MKDTPPGTPTLSSTILFFSLPIGLLRNGKSGSYFGAKRPLPLLSCFGVGRWKPSILWAGPVFLFRQWVEVRERRSRALVRHAISASVKAKRLGCSCPDQYTWPYDLILRTTEKQCSCVLGLACRLQRVPRGERSPHPGRCQRVLFACR